MKKLRVTGFLIFLAAFLLSSCGSKPYYQTNVGKKKQKYYNDIQYGRDPNPVKKF